MKQLAEWVTTTAERLADAAPAMPDGVTDRPAEIWEPLLAVADAAGGHWPGTARAACAHFIAQSQNRAASLGTRLLADLRDLFEEAGTDRMRTTEILTALSALDEAPWGDLYGRPLDARRLAKELERYGVKPCPLRTGGDVQKGYQTGGTHGLADAWRRYLPAPEHDAHPAPADPPGYLGYPGYRPAQTGNRTEPGNRTSGYPATPVTAPAVTPDPSVTALTSEVTPVTEVTAPARPTGPEGHRP